jgi:hypothetical protein
MLSAAKHLVLRPFASLRVTHKCANLVWFDLALVGCACAPESRRKDPVRKRTLPTASKRPRNRLLSASELRAGFIYSIPLILTFPHKGGRDPQA